MPQGGEPLLAFDTIKYLVSIAKAGASQRQKELDIVITSNLAFLTDEILAYCKTEGIKLSASLDGPASSTTQTALGPEEIATKLRLQASKGPGALLVLNG